MKAWKLVNSNSRLPALASVLAVAATLAQPLAEAAAISSLVSGQPFASVATGQLKSTGLELLTDAGLDLLAAAEGKAYTWDYAWTLKGGLDIQNGTTLAPPLGDGGVEVSRTAQSKGILGRFAQATGTANVTTKAIDMKIKANRFSVAKSVTGVGTTVKTAGARAATVVLTTLANIALDPVFDVPGIEVLSLDGLGSTEPVFPLPDDYFVRPAGFSYEVLAQGPNQASASLLRILGELRLDPLSGALSLSVTDSTGRLSCTGSSCVGPGGHFASLIDPGSGSVVGFELVAPETFALPWTVPEAWSCEGQPDCDPNFALSAEGGLFARAFDNEIPAPPTLPLVLSGLALLWFRRKHD
jgi:hypothetical protein